MTCGWYDKNDYVGGHAHTATMRFNGGQVPVDTAFVIFNTDTYPIFSKLLDHLGVASRRAPTSFSWNIDGRGVDFVDGRGQFRVRRRDWFKPGLYPMIIEALRFFRRASSLTVEGADGAGLTIAAYLEREGYSWEFIYNIILPQAAALWSLPLAACRGLHALGVRCGIRRSQVSLRRQSP